MPTITIPDDDFTALTIDGKSFNSLKAAYDSVKGDWQELDNAVLIYVAALLQRANTNQQDRENAETIKMMVKAAQLEADATAKTAELEAHRAELVAANDLLEKVRGAITDDAHPVAAILKEAADSKAEEARMSALSDRERRRKELRKELDSLETVE